MQEPNLSDLLGSIQLTSQQLIKKLSATPVLHAQNVTGTSAGPGDAQASLQANKATFFFRLVSDLGELGETGESQVELTIPLRSGTRAREGQCVLLAEGGGGRPWLSVIFQMAQMLMRGPARTPVEDAARQETNDASKE